MLIGNIGLATDFTENQIRATSLFAKGILRLGEPEGGRAVVINSITGKKFVSGGPTSFNEIISQASASGVSEFKPIFGASVNQITSGAVPTESQYQRLSDITRSLNEGVFNSTSDFSREAKLFAGIEDTTGPLTIERIAFMREGAMGSRGREVAAGEYSSLQLRLQEMFDGMFRSGAFAGSADDFLASEATTASRVGLLNIQQEGAVLMRFRIGEGDSAKYLTSEQINRLLSFTGSDILGEAKMAKLLGSTVDDFIDDAGNDLLTTIGTAVSKGAKREKAHTSARNFAIGSDTMDDLLQTMRSTMTRNNTGLSRRINRKF